MLLHDKKFISAYIQSKLKFDVKFKRKYNRLFSNLLVKNKNIEMTRNIMDKWVMSHYIPFNIFYSDSQYSMLTSRNVDRGYNPDEALHYSYLKEALTQNYTFCQFDVNGDMIRKNKKRSSFFVNRYMIDRNHDVNLYFPKDKKGGKLVGVEIECIVPIEKIEAIMLEKYKIKRNGNSIYSFAYDFFAKWVVENKYKFLTFSSDGSINGYNSEKETGIEFKCLIDLDEGFDQFKKFCDLLRSLKVRVNSTCGLHVHLDQRHILKDNAQLFAKVKRMNNALFGLKFIVPKSRVNNNNYCRLVPNYSSNLYHYINDNYERARDCLHNGNTNRYSAINATCLDTKGTIEVRLHSGTTSFEKIRNWIEIVYNISNNTNFDNNTFNSNELVDLTANSELNDVFIKLMNFTEDKEYLAHYITERFNRFRFIDNEGSEDERSISAISTELALNVINRVRSQISTTVTQREADRLGARAEELNRINNLTYGIDWGQFVAANPRNGANRRIGSAIIPQDVRLMESPPVSFASEMVEATPLEPRSQTVVERQQALRAQRRQVFDTESRNEEGE